MYIFYLILRSDSHSQHSDVQKDKPTEPTNSVEPNQWTSERAIHRPNGQPTKRPTARPTFPDNTDNQRFALSYFVCRCTCVLLEWQSQHKARARGWAKTFIYIKNSSEMVLTQIVQIFGLNVIIIHFQFFSFSVFQFEWNGYYLTTNFSGPSTGGS